MSDFDDNLVRKQSEELSQFLGKIQILFKEKLDGVLSEDEYLEEIEKLSTVIIEKLNHIADDACESSHEIFFKNLIHTTLLAQIKRHFAYHTALATIDNVVRLYNQDLGDTVLTLDNAGLADMISQIDQIHVAKILIQALGIGMDEQQRIINHLIDSNFKNVRFKGQD